MKLLLILTLLLSLGPPLQAQTSESDFELPQVFRMSDLGAEYQGWNNCGPATPGPTRSNTSITKTTNTAPAEWAQAQLRRQERQPLADGRIR